MKRKNHAASETTPSTPFLLEQFFTEKMEDATGSNQKAVDVTTEVKFSYLTAIKSVKT